MLAARFGNRKIVKLLLEMGADVHLADAVRIDSVYHLIHMYWAPNAHPIFYTCFNGFQRLCSLTARLWTWRERYRIVLR